MGREIGHFVSEETKKKISLANRGKKKKPFTFEHIKNMSLAQLGKKFTEEHKQKLRLGHIGQIPWCKGKKLSFEHRKSISQTKGNRTGWLTKKNYSERRQIMNSIEYKDWRKEVFKRDDYRCLDCGERGKELHADHIYPFSRFPRLRLMIENGRTLCVDCHRKTDTWGSQQRLDVV